MVSNEKKSSMRLTIEEYDLLFYSLDQKWMADYDKTQKKTGEARVNWENSLKRTSELRNKIFRKTTEYALRKRNSQFHQILRKGASPSSTCKHDFRIAEGDKVGLQKQCLKCGAANPKEAV
jgi:hypothetical protein